MYENGKKYHLQLRKIVFHCEFLFAGIEFGYFVFLKLFQSHLQTQKPNSISAQIKRIVQNNTYLVAETNIIIG